MSFSIKLGNFLYKNVFRLYNLLYPVFKKRQDVKELNLIRSIVKPGNNILDIGANIGFYTRIFSELIEPDGRVFAFEPEPLNFKYLQQNCKQLSNVSLNDKAVSDTTGVLKIYLSKMLNVDHRTYKIDDYSEVKEIAAVSIDDYLKTLGNPGIDFIKMDIQGFEMSALKGMLQTLKKNQGIQLISELWPYGLKKAGSSAAEMVQLLSSEGFKIYLLSSTPTRLITSENVNELQVNEDIYYNVFISRGKERL